MGVWWLSALLCAAASPPPPRVVQYKLGLTPPLTDTTAADYHSTGVQLRCTAQYRYGREGEWLGGLARELWGGGGAAQPLLTVTQDGQPVTAALLSVDQQPPPTDSSAMLRLGPLKPLGLQPSSFATQLRVSLTGAAVPELANWSGIEWPVAEVHVMPAVGEWEDRVQRTMEAAEEVGAVASGISGVGSAVSAGALAVAIGDECVRHGKERTMSQTLHPTQLRVGGSMHLGCVIMNSAIAAGALGLHASLVFALGAAAARWERFRLRISGARGRVVVDANTAAAALRFPAIAFCAELLVGPGAVAAGVHLMSAAGTAVDGVVGALSVAVHGLFMPWLLRRVMRDASWRSCFRYDHPLPTETCSRRAALFWLIGPGEWANTVTGSLFRQRHGILFNDAAPGRWWNVVVSHAVNVLVAATRGVPRMSATHCGAGALAAAVLFGVHGVLLACLRPRNRPWDQWLAQAEAWLMFMAMLLEAAGFFRDDPPGSTSYWLAGLLIRVLTAGVILRIVLDLASEAVVWAKHRRWQIQEALWLEKQGEGQRPAASARRDSPASDDDGEAVTLTVLPSPLLLQGSPRRRSAPFASGRGLRRQKARSLSAIPCSPVSPGPAPPGRRRRPSAPHVSAEDGSRTPPSGQLSLPRPRRRRESAGAGSRRRKDDAEAPASSQRRRGCATPRTALPTQAMGVSGESQASDYGFFRAASDSQMHLMRTVAGRGNRLAATEEAAGSPVSTQASEDTISLRRFDDSAQHTHTSFDGALLHANPMLRSPDLVPAAAPAGRGRRRVSKASVA
eukprot:TRINITY_DN24518_c0_g1_i1.p1 TRINITY_DN24518_c0_g1~~TRINITY_DN24518_c0_g1_i1.p1  ORF type:complete len:791 (+),score=209.90 TRINITY_DN24518_c0_g1_i1:61-2433(+)